VIGVILSVCLSVSGITEKVMININEFGMNLVLFLACR